MAVTRELLRTRSQPGRLVDRSDRQLSFGPLKQDGGTRMSVEFDELIVIPARYRSSRLPGKPLVDIDGIPMIVRTAQRCLQVLPREQIIVATDDERIAEVCSAAGFRVEMTRDDHLTGGDRVAEVARRIPARTIINVQGDEPVFNPDDIRTIITAARTNRDRVLTGYCPLAAHEWEDTKFPRLVFGLQKQLIYIGRAQVPGSHDGTFRFGYRHVCVYAYPPDLLEAFAAVQQRTPLEAVEDHEIMRFLEMGLPVEVVELSSESVAVDRPSDIDRAVRALARESREHAPS